MKKAVPVLAGLILLMTTATAVHSAPPPLSPEKMWEYSDAIVVVEVLSITHTGKKGLQDEPVYSVKMHVREVKKGNLNVGHVMIWEMSDYQPAPGDYGGGLFYLGERALLYLEQFPNGQFNTWGHDCVEMIKQAPENERRLPERPGETIYRNGFLRCLGRHLPNGVRPG